MNKRFITSVLVLIYVSFIVSQSYACTDDPPIPSIASEEYQDVPIGSVDFNGVGTEIPETGSYDPDNGSPYGGGHGIDKYFWKYGDDPNDPNWHEDGGTPSHVYDTAGVYDVALFVVDDDNTPSDGNDYCEVWVYEVNEVVESGTLDSGPLFVGLNEEVSLIAIPYPNYPLYYPVDATIWEVNQPAGGNAVLEPDCNSLTTTLKNLTVGGEYIVTAKCGPNDPGDEITIYVVEVVDVNWETYGTNTALETCPKNGGYRIFPGKKDPNDPNIAERRLVKVKATLNFAPPADDGVYVRFTLWDVDDPSSNTAPIDPGDSAPDPNEHSKDNRGSYYFYYFYYGSCKVSILADSNNVVEQNATISMYPGDNYRVTATTCEADDLELNHYKVENNDLPDSVKRTPMLTTWRKLWIEQDSMNVVADTGSEMNFVFGTDAQYVFPAPGIGAWTEVNLGLNLPSAFSYEGQFNPLGHFIVCGESPGIVMNNTAYLFDLDFVWVLGDISDYGSGVYKLYDDDYRLDPVHGCVPHISLPTYPVMGTYDSKYEQAYIKIKYLHGGYSDVVPFDRNLPISTAASGGGTWNDYRDCSGSEAFWNALVVTGYQGDETKDLDGNGDTLKLCGVTNDDEEIVLYLETIRDIGGAPDVNEVMMHEIGHSGGLVESSRAVDDGHCGNSGCIMEAGSTGTQFCEECIDDMRSKST